MRFNITETRKKTLASEIKAITNKNDYILVLEIVPDSEAIRNLLNNDASFSITIENITPELIILD